jgi:hypothetical protein
VVGDFYAPFFTVRFLTSSPLEGKLVEPKKGVETNATITEADTLIIQSGTQSVELVTDGRTTSLRNYAASLQVTHQGGSAVMVELRLEPPLDDALVLIEQRLIQFNSIMVVEWGWSSNEGADSILSDKHYFTTYEPKMEVKGTDISITIQGIDFFSSSALKRETAKKYMRNQPSADAVVYFNDYLILESLARKNNMRLNTTLCPKLDKHNQIVPLFRPRPGPGETAISIEQNEKDWIFFKKICDMNRVDFVTTGDTIFIVDLNIMAVQKYSHRLVFWNQLQNSDDIPIYS